MKFLINRNDIKDILAAVGKIVPKKSTSAIGTCVLIQAGDDTLRIIATGISSTAMSIVAANVEKSGECAVDVATLLQSVSVLPNGVISFETTDKQKLIISAGRSKSTISTMNPSEFPALQPVSSSDSMKISASDLRRLIDGMSFAVASDDNKYGLNGIYVDPQAGKEGFIRLVGTDGNRLSYIQVPGKTVNLGKCLIPLEPMLVLRNMIQSSSGDIDIRVGERTLIASFDGTTFWMRQRESEFPNYRDVLPKNSKRRIAVNVQDLLEAIRQVKVFATDSNLGKFEFGSDVLKISTRRLDVGDAVSEVSIENSGNPIAIGMNVAYLSDALNALSGYTRIYMNLGDELSPVILTPFEDVNTLHVVMPVRLDG